MKTLVVHGGPGLDSSYLKPWLEPSGDYVFYNQLGCGWDTTPLERITVERTIAQFVEMARALSARGPIGVLAHSWGSHIVLTALKTVPELVKRIAQMILVCPVPLTSARYRAAGERLRQRLPQPVADEIERLFADGSEQAGAALMQRALPYYVSGTVPQMSFHYRIPIYRTLASQLGEFDLRKVKRGRMKLAIIRGAEDYLLASDTAELVGPSTVEITLPGVGHFPFAENPLEFGDALKQAIL